jgi:hypothetical protein
MAIFCKAKITKITFFVQIKVVRGGNFGKQKGF